MPAGRREPIPAQVWIVLATTVLGWIVTSLDLQLSAFLAPQITRSLGVSSTFVGNAFFVFAVGLSLGALTLGYFSDLWIGRKRAFMYGILGTIVMTGLTGLARSGTEFMLFRFLAGVFSGAEWVGGLAILSEVAPQRHRSIMLGATQGGVGVGYGLANLFAATFAAPGATAVGWRLAYWASFGFAAVTYVVRLKVEETEQWRRLMAARAAHRRLADVAASTRALFAGRQRRYTLLAIGLFVAIGAPQGTWDFQYPAWYQSTGMGGLALTYAYEVAIALSVVAAGWFMDRVSSRWIMPAVWLAVPLSAVIWLYPRAGGAAGQAVLLFLVGFWRNPVWAIVAAYLPVMFPTRLRGTGMGITWVAGWLLGYTLSALWGTQLHAAGWGPWWIVQLILLALMPLVMIFAGVETQGRRLDFQEEDPADARTSATAGR